METSTQNKERIDELFNVGAHFGFVRSRRHPSMKPFIYGMKNKIEIFDLEQTLEELDKTLEYVRNLGRDGAMVLFVGGKSEAREAIRNGAESLDMPYVAGRWIGGSLTNFGEIRKRVQKLEDLQSQKEKGELAKYTKKERLLIDREIEKLTRLFKGLTNLKQMPKAMFVIDPKREHNAVKEAQGLGIPVVALAGSDCDLNEVDRAIPANDASVPSIAYFVGKVVAAYKEGRAAGQAAK